MTLPLLKSRCTMPSRCAASRAAAICSTIGRASSVVKGLPMRTRSESVWPESSSMVKKVCGGRPSGWWTPRSKMRQTFVCVTVRARRISRLKRSRMLSSSATSGRIVFRAIAARRTVSSAS
jgi:hypothetical protein